MWKFVLIIIGLSLVYLFIPRYDLQKKPTDGTDKYELVQAGFWSRDACNEAGRKYKEGYRCFKTNVWHGFMGNRDAYNKVREVE